ncbi:MAG: hypothetical protein HEQ32_01940 [Vampirovibrio sp.]
MFVWKIVSFGLVSVLEKYGDEIANNTKNPFDDIAIKAIVTVLKTLKF